jgi:Esterase FrsA-like
MTQTQERFIEEVTAERGPHYEPFGWHHWPEYPWLSYQFRRQLGETQEGGGAVSECFQAASRMVPGDLDSWHQEWLRVAERNEQRGDQAEAAGHVLTARAAWLRATDYYRSAEFWLSADDPRRLATFDKCERAFAKAGRYFTPPMESVQVPYEGDQVLYAHFLRAPYRVAQQPVLIAFGGLDSFKEELLFMVGRGALERGVACLLVDGPGQGGTLRRQRIPTRFDYEVPVGRCLDYLATRQDVDMGRVAVSGSSLGGYYAARAACFEHRLAAAVSHGAIWNVRENWARVTDDHMQAEQIRWVFGARSMAEALVTARDFSLEGILGNMRCPYLIVHGGYDVLGVERANTVYAAAHAAGLDVSLRFVTADETGADHCQHDNPGMGQALVGDWLADRFGIDQRALHSLRIA